MRLILKTMKKVVIEVHLQELENDGFDFLWDKIRTVYKMDKYRVFSIEKTKNEALLHVELTPV